MKPRLQKALSVLMIVPLLAGAGSAQSSTKQAMLLAMQANGKQMSVFQWKQETTVVRKGKALDPMLEELRFNQNGQIQRIMLVKPEQKRMGPLRAKKAAETKEDVQEVMQLAGLYANPKKLAEAIQKGEIWEGQGRLKVQARYVVVPTDDMVMVVNRGTYLATRVDFKTQYDKSPVNIAIDYQQLANGPSMMMRMTVQIPKDDIVVNVESFDFVRLTASNF